jgi:antitoxin YefM
MTRHVRYSEFVKDPAKYADEARDSRTPLYVDRGKSSFVILSTDEYEGLEETAHLLRSPANRKALLADDKKASKAKA